MASFEKERAPRKGVKMSRKTPGFESVGFRGYKSIGFRGLNENILLFIILKCRS